MMDDVEQDLAQIENGLIKLRRSIVLALLKPGLKSHQVRDMLTAHGLPADTELETLYGWHDGTQSQAGEVLGDMWLFPGFYLLSLEDAIANYSTFEDDPRWDSGWMPLFANGGGDFYLIDFNNSAGRPIRHFRIEEEEHPIEFGSLSDMLATLSAAFDQGIFHVDDDGCPDTDYDEFATLAARLNPHILWWNEPIDD